MNNRTPSRTPAYLAGFWSTSAYLGFLIAAGLFTAACLVFPVIIPAVATIGWFSFNIITAVVGTRLTLAALEKMNLAPESKIARYGLFFLGLATGFAAGVVGLHFMPALPYTIVTLGAAGLALASIGAGVMKSVVSALKGLFGFNKIKQVPIQAKPLETIDISSLENFHTVDPLQVHRSQLLRPQYGNDLNFGTSDISASLQSRFTPTPSSTLIPTPPHLEPSFASTTFTSGNTPEPSTTWNQLSEVHNEFETVDSNSPKTSLPRSLFDVALNDGASTKPTASLNSIAATKPVYTSDNPPPLLSQQVAMFNKTNAGLQNKPKTPPLIQVTEHPLQPERSRTP